MDATRWARLKYRFFASRIDDESTRMRTDNYIHDVDATLRYRSTVAVLGYGWEALDDDHAITTSQTLRGSLSMSSPGRRVSGRVAYATRNTDDEEATTLLKDTEYNRFDARVDGRAGGGVSLGGRVANRTRRMPDIDSEAEGWTATAYGQWRYEHFGDSGVIASDLGVDYTFADDDYDNTVGNEHVVTHAVSGRLSVDIHDHVDLSSAVTFLEVDEDLDIQKSIVSFGAEYRFGNGFSADAQYNIYNYDDYLVAGRYYTANVVWLNAGYAFSTE